MASNDPPAKPIPLPESGPVAFLTRIVRLPAANDQTPLRVICVVLIGIALAATPIPWNGLGVGALVILALSLGHLTSKP